MASSRPLRGRNPTNNPQQGPAGGLVPLRLWKGLRSTSPPAPEEVRHDRVKQAGLTNPYIVETIGFPQSGTHNGNVGASVPHVKSSPGPESLNMEPASKGVRSPTPFTFTCLILVWIAYQRNVLSCRGLCVFPQSWWLTSRRPAPSETLRTAPSSGPLRPSAGAGYCPRQTSPSSVSGRTC